MVSFTQICSNWRNLQVSQADENSNVVALSSQYTLSDSYLHALLPPKRDPAIVTRLRAGAISHRLHTAVGPRDAQSVENFVNCCTTVRKLPFEKACYKWMTLNLKATQYDWQCCYLIRHISLPVAVLEPKRWGADGVVCSNNVSILQCFRNSTLL